MFDGTDEKGRKDFTGNSISLTTRQASLLYSCILLYSSVLYTCVGYMYLYYCTYGMRREVWLVCSCGCLFVWSVQTVSWTHMQACKHLCCVHNVMYTSRGSCPLIMSHHVLVFHIYTERERECVECSQGLLVTCYTNISSSMYVHTVSSTGLLNLKLKAGVECLSVLSGVYIDH